MNAAIHWFRADLRLADNAALHAASAAADAVIPLFIFDPVILQAPDNGAPITAFMLRMLESLERDIAAAGGQLIFRHGPVLEELKAVVKATGARLLFYNRDYEPYARERDTAVEAWAREARLEVRSYKDGVLHEPTEILKDDGKPYGVYSAYARKWRKLPVDAVLPTVKFRRPAGLRLPRNIGLPTLKKLGFSTPLQLPPAGEQAARAQLDRFCSQALLRYGEGRNFPARAETSQLSPHIRMGAISPRTVFAAVSAVAKQHPESQEHLDTFTGELIWREFYRQILWHFPHAAARPMKEKFAALKWENNERLFAAWCEGRTGYPIVDAGMRQMNATGWMHNRVRMITAAFLTKDLLISYQKGERYFMQKLLDADLANNNGGWQWIASTGTDAQPYFRIFNPTSQARKFDAKEAYIRHWVPEVDSPEYSKPIVDHAQQRGKALAMFQQLLS